MNMVCKLAPARIAAIFAAAGLGILLTSGAGVRAEPQRANRAAAEDAVREALQREIYGLVEERDSLLKSAVDQLPQYAPALWHLGHVKDNRNRWITSGEFIERWTTSRSMKRYLAEREKAADTAEGQLALADYCRREGLTEQMRAALTRVLEHNPNHAGARAALGFRRMGPLWLSREEIEAEETIAQAQEESVRKWRSTMEEIAAALNGDSPRRRSMAAQRLLEQRDPSAIAAMERIISPTRDDAARAVIAALAEMPEPEASLSLARHAVYYPSLAVREEASSALGRRDLHSFAPALLDMMVTPVTSRIAAIPLPGGRIGYRHAFLRETADRQDVLVLDTEYERVAQGASQADAMRRALSEMQRTALRREFGAEQQNQATVRLNERIAWVLNRATQQDLAASPETWWKWWNDQNEVLPASQKTQAVSQEYRRVQIVDPVQLVAGGSDGGGSGIQSGGGGGECLVAGTLVWTASGPTAVEKVQRGDLVLSQDVESGELSFKPVLRTTTRPRGKIIKFTAGLETFECSGGHVFWVSGEGWMKASQLESGMLLHTASGPAPIVSVDRGTDAETFNLVVADFSTYFVGQQKILSHDFTMRRATSAVVPGLRPE
jgi:hypothetical protein